VPRKRLSTPTSSLFILWMLGKCRVDLMRGDEPYKYEWGAQDEPIQRLLVRREAGS
jgi:CelD/BcsL family acetyltransferase involved in cellulose biosynthesis